MSYPIVKLPRPYPNEYCHRLYDYVLEHKPKVIVEFGSSWGSSTIFMAKALKELGEGGRIWTCDNHPQTVDGDGTGTLNCEDYNCKTVENFKLYEVDDIIDFHFCDYNEWFKKPYEFDLCYIDIHNDGKKLQNIFDNEFFKSQIDSGKKVLFEGGSSKRSSVAMLRGMKSFDLIKYKYNLIFGDDNTKHVLGELSE